MVGDYSKKIHFFDSFNSKTLPKVSIIILNYNKSYYARLAANSVALSTSSLPYEIILFDNGSIDNDYTELCKISPSFKLIRSKTNLGIGDANNAASTAARGEYLLFLNNDSFLEVSCIENMLEAYTVFPDCGIVGPIFSFPDGVLQEAGASLLPNGHPVRHGRNDPKHNILNIPRFKATDYVSAACLMIRKNDFYDMGGFSEKYSNGYGYEDTDLCMRLTLYGQKVYLSSIAKCYHVENATVSEIDHGDWVKKYSEIHRKRFLEDWGPYLASRDLKDLPWHLKRENQSTSDYTD